jgi:hypothetical protein
LDPESVPTEESPAEARSSKLSFRHAGFGVLGLLAVAVQIATFLYGFWELTGNRPTPFDAQLLASVGLTGCLVVLVVSLRLISEGLLDVEAAVAFLGFGLVVGLLLAARLPDMPGGMFGDLFLYGGIVITYGVGATAFLVLAAVIARAFDRRWWLSLLAAPVWLETGVHISLLLGLLFQAEAVAEAAAAVQVFL